MPTLLRIDASPRGDYSISKTLGKHFTAEWEQAHSGGTVVVRDLSQKPLPYVDLPWIAGAYSTPDQHTPEQKAAIKISDDLVEELLAADEILIATPMYNLSIPAALKAWIDHVVRLNRTFSPSYEGLVKGKKVTVILASGGVYTPGAPAESWNSASSYLKQVLGFIGISDVSIVLAGGTAAVDQGKTTLPEFVKPFEAEVATAAH